MLTSFEIIDDSKMLMTRQVLTLTVLITYLIMCIWYKAENLIGSNVQACKLVRDRAQTGNSRALFLEKGHITHRYKSSVDQIEVENFYSLCTNVIFLDYRHNFPILLFIILLQLVLKPELQPPPRKPLSCDLDLDYLKFW